MATSPQELGCGILTHIDFLRMHTVHLSLKAYSGRLLLVLLFIVVPYLAHFECSGPSWRMRELAVRGTGSQSFTDGQGKWVN